MITKSGRAVEWQHALIFIILGGLLLLPIDTFAPSAFIVLGNLMTEFYWGLLFIGVGLIRLIALFINGYRPVGSPTARIVGAILSMEISALFAYGFLMAFPYALWESAIFAIVLLFEIPIVYRATKDLKNGVDSRKS